MHEPMQSLLMSRRHWLVCSLMMTLWGGGFSGCTQRQDGPDRFPLSGTITYQGEPIPKGEIRFSPDRKKGNSGPGAIARIENGKYQTAKGRGTVGGPMIISLSGFDGNPVVVNDEAFDDGLPLFDPYQVEAEIPKESSTWDFDVTQPPAKKRVVR